MAVAVLGVLAVAVGVAAIVEEAEEGEAVTVVTVAIARRGASLAGNPSQQRDRGHRVDCGVRQWPLSAVLERCSPFF